jgi:hypothetical protein
VPDLALTPYNPPTATPSAPPRPTPAPPTPTSIYDALDFSALLGLVTVTGRIVDEQTGQGLAGATFLVLKPGATYDDWFQQPGVYNDVVVASASTASDGRYQASPALDHGLTYQVVILTPTCYPNLQKTLVVSSETVGTAQLPDIAARRSDGC